MKNEKKTGNNSILHKSLFEKKAVETKQKEKRKYKTKPSLANNARYCVGTYFPVHIVLNIIATLPLAELAV